MICAKISCLLAPFPNGVWVQSAKIFFSLKWNEISSSVQKVLFATPPFLMWEEVSVYKTFVLKIELNIQILTGTLCSPNSHPYEDGEEMDFNFQKHHFIRN